MHGMSSAAAFLTRGSPFWRMASDAGYDGALSAGATTASPR
jgi:hypothetical protein